MESIKYEVKSLRKISLEEMKQIELGILVRIDKICRSQGLRYSLAGGTLLGAVRHKGFIPWDDDIDVIMPRPDYEKLIDYCKKHDVDFILKTNANDRKYWSLFAKACAKKTRLDETNCNRSGLTLGVYIDIFPVDGLGDTYKEAKRRFLSTEIQREVLNAARWPKFTRSKTHALYYEPLRFLMFVVSRFVSPNKLIASIEQKCKKREFDKSAYCGYISGSYRLKEVMKRSYFSEYCEIEFENHKFHATKHYHKMLKRIYGDYLKLPPEDKRVSHHIFDAYYLDEEESENHT